MRCVVDQWSFVVDVSPHRFEATIDQLKGENKLLRLNVAGMEKKVAENKGRERAVKQAMDQVIKTRNVVNAN